MNDVPPASEFPRRAMSMEPLKGKSGSSRDGMPLALSVAPPEEFRPWVARLVAAKIGNPFDNVIACGMCNDLTYARLVLGGEWTALGKHGLGTYRDEPLLFGPHSQHMPLTCRGPVNAIGIGLQPGALHQLVGRRVEPLVDTVECSDPLGLVVDDLYTEYPPDADPQQWIDALIEALHRLFERVKPEPPDPVSAAFELAAFEDPNIAASDFAEDYGVNLRTFERTIRRDFGLSPKKVLRRARALDLASQLLGVADESEANDLLLRYFDQSHLIREFKSFFGVTPAAFRREPRPFMTLNLEIRQARRLLELGRLAPDGKLPWRDD